MNKLLNNQVARVKIYEDTTRPPHIVDSMEKYEGKIVVIRKEPGDLICYIKGDPQSFSWELNDFKKANTL
jgi:hypothetical protein